MKKRIMLMITVWFYGAMLILSCFAREIHNSFLVHVKTQVLPVKMFLFYEDETRENVVKNKCYAIKTELVQQKEYYIISDEERYGETRRIIRSIHLELGEEIDGYYPVVGGDYNGENLVVASDGMLCDGLEVLID